MRDSRTIIIDANNSREFEYILNLHSIQNRFVHNGERTNFYLIGETEELDKAEKIANNFDIIILTAKLKKNPSLIENFDTFTKNAGVEIIRSKKTFFGWKIAFQGHTVNALVFEKWLRNLS